MREDLAALFLAAAQAVERRLGEVGLPLTQPAFRATIQRHGPGSWGTSHEEYAANILTVADITIRGGPWLNEAEAAAVFAVSARLAASAQETLPFVAFLGGRVWPLIESLADRPLEAPAFEDKPSDWVARALVMPALLWHLEHLPSVDAADQPAADAFADEVLRVAHDDKLRYRLTMPLSGMEVAPPDTVIVIDDFTIREMPATEQVEWFEAHGGSGMAWHFHGTEPPQIAIEYDLEGPRDQQQMLGSNLGQDLALALQLHGYEIAGKMITQTSTPRWVLGGASGAPLALPGRARGSAPITPHQFHEAVTTSKRLGTYNRHVPQSAADLAVHRFITGAARQSDADAVLDFTIVLESLLLPYDENARRGDLSYRFRVHGAYYLASDSRERQAVAKQLGSIYETRSRLVHGGKYPDNTKISEARDIAYNLARRGLLRAIHSGFPTATQFSEMVLGPAELQE